jgi:hypothetical protein
MKRCLLILFTLFTLLAAACAGSTGDGTGISSNLQRATAVVPTGTAQVVSPAELAAEPQSYLDELLQVTGQYRRGPVVICDGLTRFSPAEWVLTGEQGEESVPTLAVSGFENLVQPLLPVGMTVTVEGVWRYWRGPVGCGKEAPVEEVWYLELTEIISPSPIARVTLTPQGQQNGGGSTVATPAGQTPEPVGTPGTEPSPTQESAPTATRANGSADPTQQGPTATVSPTTRPTEEVEETPTQGTPTPGATPATATATSEATDEPDATATATATATQAASGATATPTRSVVDNGALDYMDLRGDFIGSSEMHSWQFQVRAGDVITIQVAARQETDVALTVLDPGGNRVVEQNNSPAGQIEQIAAMEASGTGAYRVLISEANHEETDYALLLLNDSHEDYYNFVFSGLLSYGASRTADIPTETDQFWFFFGVAGDSINVNVAPDEATDIFMDLYEPDGSLMVNPIDTGGAGAAEQLLNYRLPSTGLFGIRVGEFDLQAGSYTILVARN